MIVLKELMKLMSGSKNGTYPLVHIEDWGTKSNIAGDFGYVDQVLKLENNPEYAFLLEAEVTSIDFSKSGGEEIYLEVEVQS